MKQPSEIAYARKFLSACITILCCSFLFTPFLYRELDYLTGLSIMYFFLFIGVFLYGIVASILSDAIANFIVKDKIYIKIFLSGIFHALFGLIIGFPLMLVALFYFLTDRIAAYLGYRSWKISTLSVSVLTVVFLAL